jgi:hypothetical protein
MDPIMIPVLAILSAPVIAIGLPIARALARRIESQGAQPRVPADLADLADRLARMEQAIDAIAVEVERISEGQRFTTKLLADGGARPAVGALGTGGARVERASAPTPP